MCTQATTEDTAITEFLKRRGSSTKPSPASNAKTVVAFIKTLRQISSPMDAYEHNKPFRDAVLSAGIEMRWGRVASHRYDHAYVIKYAEQEGCYLTILTDYDFGLWDESSFPWNNYDLFEDVKGGIRLG